MPSSHIPGEFCELFVMLVLSGLRDVERHRGIRTDPANDSRGRMSPKLGPKYNVFWYIRCPSTTWSWYIHQVS